MSYILEGLNTCSFKEKDDYILHKCENDNGIFKKNDILLIKEIDRINNKNKISFILSKTEIGHVIGLIREDNIIEL